MQQPPAAAHCCHGIAQMPPHHRSAPTEPSPPAPLSTPVSVGAAAALHLDASLA
eukprot:CAMPEP_0177757634 /NCGR_PEP_ID=MMETSP0491_2-20121128/3747_1 /TAXON_ID=63592 /ORGANISM="Tetraselmis chuii, Strain PLY429" /LENGTH=53 /DNA_ID=CAMNT_0019273297 /DNA_START=537 /DNA_END=694 /DNA_ORIENTATION=+